MAILKLGRGKKYTSKSLMKVTGLFCMAVFIFSLPIALLFESSSRATIYGVPIGFYIATLLGPLLILSLLMWYAKIANDIDRHAPETENE